MYLFVLIALRIMGKRQVGDMQQGELVITILISEIAAVPLQDPSGPIVNGILSVLLLVVVEVLISVVSLKCFKVGKFFGGNAALLIKDGIIDQSAMEKVRVTVMDLIELLRKQGYFDVSEIDFAVLEASGDLSVMPKQKYAPLTLDEYKSCQKGNLDKKGLPIAVICDGVLVKDAMQSANISKAQVYDILAGKKLKTKDVFLLTIDEYGNYYLVKKGGNSK